MNKPKGVTDLEERIATLRQEESHLEALIKKELDINEKKKIKKQLATCRMLLTKSENKLNIYKAHFNL